ncbi:hypothetical protein YC2023_091019 [Brassica napus]
MELCKIIEILLKCIKNHPNDLGRQNAKNSSDRNGNYERLSNPFILGSSSPNFLCFLSTSYHTGPDITISCKCMVDQQQKIDSNSTSQAELNGLRHLILDVSCLIKILNCIVMFIPNMVVMTLPTRHPKRN